MKTDVDNFLQMAFASERYTPDQMTRLAFELHFRLLKVRFGGDSFATAMSFIKEIKEYPLSNLQPTHEITKHDTPHHDSRNMARLDRTRTA